MNSLRIAFVILLCAFSAFDVCAGLNNIDTRHHSLVIERARGGTIVYRSEGRQLKVTALYDFAAERIKRYGEDVPYFVIFSLDVDIASVINVSGILGAVGYGNTRFFAFSEEHEKMQEISFGRSYPYDLEAAEFVPGTH
jgi:hypothetical protein